MYRIEAIIQPFKLDSVKDALKAIGIDGITVSEVRGHGRQQGHKEVYRGREYDVDLLPKVKLDMVIPAERKDEVIRTLVDSARTGKIGDGKIFVSEILEAIRIRDDHRGDSVLWCTRLRAQRRYSCRRQAVRRKSCRIYACVPSLRLFCYVPLFSSAPPRGRSGTTAC